MFAFAKLLTVRTPAVPPNPHLRRRFPPERETAASWCYEITNKNNTITISFHNSNIQNGVPIAILLQYGHGTGTGGWVQGRDYINPAIQPIFDQIAEYAWKEVTRS